MNTIIITEGDLEEFKDYKGEHWFENFIFNEFRLIFKREDFKIIYKVYINGKINKVKFRVIQDGWYSDCEFSFEDCEDNVIWIEKPKGEFVEKAIENNGEGNEKEVLDYFTTEVLFISYLKQYIMNKSYDRKIVMKESKKETDSDVDTVATIHAKSIKKGPHKPVTQFLLNDIIEYTSSSGKKHNGYRCDVWGVRGHFRRYKSGKVVWIDSFEKGKCRNTGKTTTSKRYKL